MTFYLDIDGVMIPAKSWEAPPLLSDGFPAFSKQAVETLLAVLNETDEIILTTSHKSNFTLLDWKNIFATRGIPIKRLSTLPENINHRTRLQELLDWFNQHPHTGSFVILDDDTGLNNLPQAIKQHLVLTSSTVGLVSQHIETIKVLRGKLETALNSHLTMSVNK